MQKNLRAPLRPCGFAVELFYRKDAMERGFARNEPANWGELHISQVCLLNNGSMQPVKG